MCQSIMTGELTQCIFYFYLFSYLIMCVFVCEWVCALELRCLWSPEEGIGSPGAIGTAGWEPPDMGVRNQIWVFWKSGTQSS